MTRHLWIPCALTLGLMACGGTAHADRPAAPSKGSALMPVQRPAESPYVIELIGAQQGSLDTYRHKGRFYVHGESGERYSIRIQNPTDRRIEAVVSVDGLDVIDGRDANYRSKRGYIIPARGNVVIDGFRISTEQVAAFRFSSVSNSYAARKGKARNVGVIGVAIFEEKEQPAIAIPRHGIRPRPTDPRPEPMPPYDRWDEDDASGEAEAPSADAPAPRRSTRGASKSGAGVRIGKDQAARPNKRPGLGTAWGEHRSSVVRFTQFERANKNKPDVLAELRYNDREGLIALGIKIPPVFNADEIATRESADPFPGMRFAQPPPPRR